MIRRIRKFKKYHPHTWHTLMGINIAWIAIILFISIKYLILSTLPLLLGSIAILSITVIIVIVFACFDYKKESQTKKIYILYLYGMEETICIRRFKL